MGVGQNQCVQTRDVIGVLDGSERGHGRAVGKVQVIKCRQAVLQLDITSGGDAIANGSTCRETYELRAFCIQMLQIGAVGEVDIVELCTAAHIKPFECSQTVF